MFPLRVVALLAAFFHMGCFAGDVFLSTTAEPTQEDRQLFLLSRLQNELGEDQLQKTEALAADLFNDFEPTIRSLPTSPEGALSASSARYLLHRVFMQRRGWTLKGASPDGGSWSPPSSVLGVGAYLPPGLRELLEGHLGLHGEYTPEEVMLLAATLEALIRAEAAEKLGESYKLLGFSEKGGVQEEEAATVVDLYLQVAFMGLNASQLSPAEAKEVGRNFGDHCPYWEQMSKSVEEAQQQVAPGLTSYALSDIVRLMEGVDERLARHLDQTNCKEMRGHLTQMEERAGTGRVRLHDFYGSVVDGRAWQFSDSVDFLKETGMLDESDASQPRVLIANYLYMHGDCLEVSSFYNLCCINPCEGLMGHLERSIRAPHATPDEIVRLVSALPSQSVPENRILAPVLVKKLEEIARNNEGMVPLHGRLFAQWMHFAYPLECPYPHVSGTTKIMSNSAWYQERGVESVLNETEMKQYMESLSVAPPNDIVDSALQGWEEQEGDKMLEMWADEEELVDATWGRARLALPTLAPRPQPRGASWELRAYIFLALLVPSAAGMKYLVRQGILSGGAAREGEKSETDSKAVPFSL